VPERTFITVTGQIDLTQVPALVPTEAQAKLEATLELAGRALFGRDFKTEVLPALGPDWGAYVAAPPDGEPGWFPDVVLALRVRNAAGGDRPLDRALLDALRAVAGLAILEPVQKGQAVRMQTGLQDGEPLFWLSNDREWPAGCRPTGAVKAGYLLLASSPGAVRRFGARPGPAAGAPPVARVSFAEVAAYLRHQERRGALVAALAEANHQPAPAINGQLDQLLAVLDFLKEAELAFQATPAQLNLRLRLQPAQPLR
jgi:hypothetical protein